jgi:general secretion pathway protein G
MRLPISAHHINRKSAFTLLEVLIALALLAAIAALLIGNLDRVLGGGRTEVARIYVNETLETPLMNFRIHMGRYPTTEEGLQALLTRPSDEATNWQGPYVRRLPNDPWGNAYQYRFPGERNPERFDLWSFGPDGVDSDRNIGNWEPTGER